MRKIEICLLLALVSVLTQAANAAVFIVNPDYEVRPLEESANIGVRAEVTANRNEVPFRSIGSAIDSAKGKKQNIVVKTPVAWERLWREIHADQSPPPEVPKIDFFKKMVIGVFLGNKPTGGYDFQIKRVLKTDAKRLDVHFTEIRPGKSCIVTQGNTSPYHLVEVDRFNGRVNFQARIAINNCR